MKKYFIGELEFKTKKESENYTRNIINKLGCCIINKDHIYFNFFDNLILNHPECDDKKGIGIDYFYIQPNPVDRRYYQTMIKRLDGHEIDFSWVYCCQFKKRTIRYDLLRAMRESINYYTNEYKLKQSKIICNFCKIENAPYENYHVDHDNPSFQTLSDNFLQLTKNIPSSFGDCKKYNLTIFKDEDKDFKNDWVDYHNKNCNFQILCRDCNLRKKKI